eukprot:TRINITY_DN21296_c0_g2_i1.p1 TRINITY_DN21296_c0_g2~~TRINITY_DN21296_c0_g2_i1.p1  ORF type:complete len:590 (+),score=191.19 TRINITY_DN21296_c0_g2_i1:47-1816(+)
MASEGRWSCSVLVVLLALAVAVVAHSALRRREDIEVLQRERDLLLRDAAAAKQHALRGGGAASLILEGEVRDLVKRQRKRGPDGTPAVPSTVAATHARAKSISGAGLRSSAGGDLVSHAHCIGLEPGRKTPDENGWKRGTCHFRNLCFDTRDSDAIPQDRFLFHRADGDDFGDKHSVALGAVNAQWTAQQTRRIRWAPKVVPGPLAKGKYRMAPAGDLWVVHAEHCAANAMHLIMDSFLPWYAGASLFGMEDMRLRPLRVPIRNPGLWGTCDFIQEEEKKGTGWARGYYARCTKNTAKWLQAMLPGTPRAIFTTDDLLKEQQTQHNDGKPLCFPDVVAGVGVLSDHCLRSHGWSSWDRNDRTMHDCNQGRGALLYGFRSHMLKTVGVAWPVPPPPRHRVALFRGGHRAGSAWSGIERALQNSMRSFSAQAGTPEIWAGDLAHSNAKDQMHLLTQTSVAVAAMGGNAVTLLFLPRGAGAVLLHDGKDWLDWDVWAHCSWMRAQWMAIASPPTKVAAEVVRQLRKYDAFRATPAPEPSGNAPRFVQMDALVDELPRDLALPRRVAVDDDAAAASQQRFLSQLRASGRIRQQ